MYQSQAIQESCLAASGFPGTGSLDARNRDIVLAMLRQLNEEGKTIVVVTHDPTVSACAKRHINLG